MSPIASKQNASIFLNYRREDSKDVTTRLYDDLRYTVGNHNVFMDLKSIVPGKDWPQDIQKTLSLAKVVIVVIGRDWLKVQDSETFQRRLDAEGDWVRLEIEEALRQNKIVIPVIVRDASLPREKQLPPSIQELANKEAIVITAEDWQACVRRLIDALVKHGIQSLRDVEDRPLRAEPSMLGVIDYFYRRIGKVVDSNSNRIQPIPHVVNCSGMSDLWQFIDDLVLQQQPINEAPAVRIQGQISPYAPLLFGKPSYKRKLHLQLRQGAVHLIEDLGYEFGELLNGLLSYSAGQMVIRPYFVTKYAFLGLYESIVRNSIPVMIERNYYNSTLGSLFRRFNTLDVSLQAYLGEIPNFTKDALDDFGITERLISVLGEETIAKVGTPNYALFIEGDNDTYIDGQAIGETPMISRYLDGDVWVANSQNSLITRFIDISSREDMLNAVTEIIRELQTSTHGRGIVSSFDVRIVPVEETMPDKVLSADQL